MPAPRRPQYTTEQETWRSTTLEVLRTAGVPILRIILDPATQTIWTPDPAARNLLRARQITMDEARALSGARPLGG